ncbi:hypothetical protein, partial [Bacillus atrophaeus]
MLDGKKISVRQLSNDTDYVFATV